MTSWKVVNICLLWGLLISCSETKQESNHLANSSSPYLREHADNPVNWYEWGDDAFEKAARENKPVIVSIGYASCHWCHVMERESFMDPEVAKLMNENFVSIKVDREERPDVDQQFIYASQALTGTAGWPLNGFALENGKPFHTITYYPKDAWIDLLNKVTAAWKDDSDKIKAQAAELTKNIKPLFEYQNPDSSLRLDLKAFLNRVRSAGSSLDFNNGGLKGAPKFPMPSMIEFMLQYSYITGDKKALEWVTTTLDGMAHGGIYDQIGGGFARYSTDSSWHVPHFEKMLYDNAQLLSIYSNAYKVTKDESYKRIVHGILDFAVNELMIPDSGFISSIDADSEGEEGKYYKWTAGEFSSVLGNDAPAAMAYYGVEGNNGSTLRRAGLAADPTIAMWQSILLESRKKRPYPSTDKKLITSWNAMMIVGLLDSWAITRDSNHIHYAFKTAALLDSAMLKDDRVYRSLYKNQPTVEGFLEDYAWMAKAYISMYELSLDIQYLQRARKIADLAIQKFKNDDSPFFYYSVDNQNSRLIRNTELYDQVIPSSNSVFAEVLLKLGEYYQESKYTTLAENAVKEMVSSISLDITAISNWARLAQVIDFGPYQIAITGTHPYGVAMKLHEHYLPASIIMGGTEENLPLLENKLVDGQETIYVCRNRVCKLPVKDIKSALRQIVYR